MNNEKSTELEFKMNSYLGNIEASKITNLKILK